MVMQPTHGSDGRRDPAAPQVSVVIPTHNRSAMVVRAVRSALAQRDVSVEVIVTDDGSQDDTAAALAALSDARVLVLRNAESVGVAEARNRALRHARGRWVAFLDDDDEWAPDKLRLQLEALHACAGARWSCVGAVWLHDGAWGRPAHPPASGVQDRVLLQRNTVPGGASGVLAERGLVMSLDGFDTRFSTLADWDLWLRLAMASPVACVDSPLVAYTVHASSMSHDVRRTQRELVLFTEKWEEQRSRAGVKINRAEMLWYTAAWQLRNGQRWGAARAHLELALCERDRPGRAVLAAVCGLAWPRVQHLRDRSARRRLSAAWRSDLATWLPDGSALG